MYTSQMRMTGFSGMDIDSMVTSLMDAHSMKLYKLQKTSQSLTWKQEAYRGIGNALKGFQSKYLAFGANTSTNMASQAAFANFKTSIKGIDGANSSAVNIRTNATSKPGTHKLDVLQLAKTASVTSDPNYMLGNEANAIDKIYDSLNSGETISFSMSYNDGGFKEITINKDDLNALKDLEEPGEFAGFEFDDLNLENKDDRELLKKAFSEVVNSKLDKAFGKTINSDRVEVPKLSVDFNETKEGDISEMFFKATAGNTFTLGGPMDKVDGEGNTTVSTDTSLLDLVGMQDGQINRIANTAAPLGGLMGAPEGAGAETTYSLKINDVKFEFNALTSVKDMMDKINNNEEAGVKISQNALTGAFTIESTTSGSEGKVNIEDIIEEGEEKPSILKRVFGFTAFEATLGQDSIIVIDGVAKPFSSNSISIEEYGISLDLLAETDKDKPLTITIENNTDETFDKVKGFIEEYNKLLSSMQDEVRTRRPKSDKYTHYEPLLEHEKQALSDKEIENYEEKAKTGLLYNDSNIGSIASKLRNLMGSSVTLEDGSKISLMTIGVSLGKDYSKGGELTIDEKKLREAIETNPDAVARLFNAPKNEKEPDKVGIAQRFNQIVDSATHVVDGTLTKLAGFENSSSATTNTIYDQLKDLRSKMSYMTEQLAAKENMYYKKFSAMEAAMMKADSQLSNILSMMGN